MSKKKQKSIEELLEEALVPEEEQPYSLPENWVWVRLKSINKDKKRNIDPRDYSEEVFELYSVPSYDLGEPEYIKGKEIGSNKQVVKENEILLCKINPRINRVWIVLNNRGKYRQLASTEWIVISENKVIYPKYLLFLLKAPYFRKLITSNVSGVGGSLTRAKPKEVETYPIALPPLNEQKRIAEKIERLFAKIDEAKRLIEEVKESFERRRAAILDKAFKGQLGTNDPNEESMLETSNGIKEKNLVPKEEQPYEVPKNWVWVRVGDLVELERGITFPSSAKKDKREERLIGCARTANVQDEFRWDDLIYVDKKYLKNNDKKLLRKGDIVMSTANSYYLVGKVSYIHELIEPITFGGFIMSIRAKNPVNQKFLYYYFREQFLNGKVQKLASQTTNIANLNGKKIKSLSLPLPPLNEQKRIVERLDKLLGKLDEQEEMVLEVEQKLDLLKQSILNKAFRGELGTNDPNDEHAIELLKEALKSQ